MRLFVILFSILVLFGCASLLPAAPADGDGLERITGTVTVVSVGGVETPGRRCVRIGDLAFELVGERALVDALFENEGHEVEVRGSVTNPMYLGGEGRSLLTVVSVERICKCSAAGSARSARLAKLASMRVLEELTEAEARCATDALARYATRHPSDDPSIVDGIQSAVRSVSTEAAGVVCVRCERFGGIAAIWHGGAVEYRYDATGRFVDERATSATDGR